MVLYCVVVYLLPLYLSQTKGAEDLKRVMMNNIDINITRVRKWEYMMIDFSAIGLELCSDGCIFMYDALR